MSRLAGLIARFGSSGAPTVRSKPPSKIGVQRTVAPHRRPTASTWVEARYEEGGLGGSLSFPLLADLNKEVTKDFEVLVDGAGVALRGLFLIDPEGTVMQATINNLPVGRSAKEALRQLKAFQYVTSHEGEVCPADWDEGADTMQANPDGMREYLSQHNG